MKILRKLWLLQLNQNFGIYIINSLFYDNNNNNNNNLQDKDKDNHKDKDNLIKQVSYRKILNSHNSYKEYRKILPYCKHTCNNYNNQILKHMNILCKINKHSSNYYCKVL